MPHLEISVTPYKPTRAERLQRTAKVLGVAIVAATAIESALYLGVRHGGDSSMPLPVPSGEIGSPQTVHDEHATAAGEDPIHHPYRLE